MTRPVVLATRSTGLGDLCTVVPALRALRRAYPEHDLVVATPERFRPLALAAGAVDVVHTEGLGPLPRSFHAVDVAVNLHGCGPESIERLVALGETPPVYLSANVAGGDEHNRALESRYAGRIRR